MLMSFKENLINLRTEKNISEEEMAKHLSCTVEEYKALELEKREPKLQELIACAKVFNVSTDFLLDNQEEAKKKEKKPFDPLSALAGMALPGGFSITSGEDNDDDIDEELALQLAEMASAIDIKRRRKEDWNKWRKLIVNI